MPSPGAAPAIAHHDLATLVVETCQLSGEFTLRSGQTSHSYFDKYLFEANPQLLSEIATHLAGLVPDEIEVVAGLELGGIAVATVLSQVTGIPAAFVRKAPKTYGTMKLAEGASIADRHVLVVEDVISTGGQVVASTHDLRSGGAIVDSVLCVIDRTGGDHRALEADGIAVLALFTTDDFA
ncbi:MAG TPA: orotate phosphoribosyltransferase [Acidimicrobiales bacterium]|nr:orotate phosphoribosyltransferase [Acidimicrobiales bacterium]